MFKKFQAYFTYSEADYVDEAASNEEVESRQKNVPLLKVSPLYLQLTYEIKLKSWPHKIS